MKNYKTQQLEMIDLNWDGNVDDDVNSKIASAFALNPSDNIAFSDSEKVSYNQFCTRMWLDNCDENLAFGSTRYTQKEYTVKFQSWLKEKWRINNGNVNSK
jgi:hypothetical protein